MSLLLSPLREVSLDRHNRAVQGLKDGTLTVTLTYKTEAEIRAMVKNGDGTLYHVNLAESGAFCSCPDARHRHTICKHIVATCISSLQQNEPTDTRIHLMWQDSTVLCGETQPRRFWQRWTYNALNWSDIVCPTCVHTWLNSSQEKEG